MATKKDMPDVFTRDALLASGYFDNRKDALAVVIKDGEEITIEEAQTRLEKFMKRKVK
jgi:hypothetical protein